MLGHLLTQSTLPEIPAWDEIPGVAWTWFLGLGETWLPRLMGSLVALLVALLVWALGRIVLAFFAKHAKKTKNELDDLIVEGLQSILAWVAFAGGAWFAVKYLQIPSLAKFVQAVVIVILAVPLTKVATRIISFLEARIASKTDTKADDIIFEITGRFSGIVIYGLALILALDHLGINITPFIAGAGVAGVAIGFAAKDTLSNLVAGILLLLDRPFEKGDRIELWNPPPNSATWGDVVDIGLRATRVRTTDNIIVVIPNNEIMMRDIINYTGQGESIRLRIRVGIAYTADVDRAKKILIAIAEELDWVAQEPSPPLVVVKKFGDSSVDLELRVWITNARKRIHTISHITDRAHGEFNKAGIEIPYPKRDIYMHQSNPRLQPPGSDKRQEERGLSCRWPVLCLAAALAAACPARGPGPDSALWEHAWAERIEAGGIENLHRVSDDLYRGAQPDREGFEALAGLGVRTVVNLRTGDDDPEDLEGLDLAYVHIPMQADDFSDGDVARFLQVVTDERNLPAFVHCLHGADRTGLVVGAYRVVVLGWSREEAVAEMTGGGFGYHRIWKKPVKWLETFDVEAMGKMAGITR
jgi:small-conductance mechanosensitive channel/protein tyrosine phosphatase (PTP) superfamily phosphohydrolase (DUF442 family)